MPVVINLKYNTEKHTFNNDYIQLLNPSAAAMQDPPVDVYVKPWIDTTVLRLDTKDIELDTAINTEREEREDAVSALKEKNDLQDAALIAEIENRINSVDLEATARTTADAVLTTTLDNVKALIPSETTAQNQLADKAFVNSSINAMASFYITYNADGDAFPTKAAFDAATVFYFAGQPRVPTKNDYCTVLSDEDHDNATTRYVYQDDGVWGFQYVVNDKPFTEEQLATINSGLTSQDKADYDGHLTNYNNPHNVTRDQLGAVSIDEFTALASRVHALEVGGEVAGDVIEAAVQVVKDTLYPIGHILISYDDNNPSNYIGGTWEQFAQGRCLIGAGTGNDGVNEQQTFDVGATGGKYLHQLTTSEMPQHNHTFTGTSATTASISTTNSGNENAHTHARGTLRIQGAVTYIGAGWTDPVATNALKIEKLSGGHTFGYGSSPYGFTQRTLTLDTNLNSASGWSGATAAGSSHKHNINHTHTLTATGTIENKGDNGSHTNVQPYVVVTFWKRVA